MDLNEPNSKNSKHPEGVQTLDARELIGEQKVLRLDLNGQIYTLRITKHGRLILTK